MGLSNLRFSTRMFILIGVVLISFLGLEWMHRRMVAELQVDKDSPVYKEVKLATDLVADILPPPEFIVEPYLVLYQLLETKSTPERLVLIQKFESLEKEYNTRHDFWVRELAEGPLKKSLTEKSYEPAKKFFQAAKTNILEPARGNSSEFPTPAILDSFRTEISGYYQEHYNEITASSGTVSLANAFVSDIEKQASNTRKSWERTQLLFGLSVLAIVLLISWAIAQSILVPMNRLMERMQDISEGAADLTQRIDVSSTDEIGHLGKLINAVIGRIHDLIARVRMSSIQLHATGTEIGAAANEQDSHTQNFSASAAQIASAVKEISATGQELLSTTNELQSRADQASGLADAGRSSLDNMQTSMQRLADATGSISTKLGVVREKASGINSVVTTITKVADQTNLLSINAAIEAEKAGEAGRGFLVVAREIRRLADQTAVATLDIEQMVRQMQAAVTAGVMEMDKFREDVRSGIHQTSSISGQMTQILDQVHNLTQQFHGVREAVSQQSLGARQIDDAMGHLVGGVKHVAGAARDFNQAASNLRESVAGLQSEVSQFKVSG
jgi:methyl-accepting chemotaxis protein WspA